MKILALDPGEKVGWARVDYDEKSGEWRDLRHGITPLKDMALKLYDSVHDYDVVIYETWRLRATEAKNHIGSEFLSSQFIGMVRLCGWVAKVKLVSQGPNLKKTGLKVAPDWLKEKLAAFPKSHDDAHDADALMHLSYYIWNRWA